MNKTLVMFVGLPGCGKSSYRHNVLKNLVAVVLSSDDYIEEMSFNEGKTYSEGFKTYIKEATDNLNEELKWAIENNKNILWDQTNLTRNVRLSKLRNIPKNYYKKCIVFEPFKSLTDWKSVLANRPDKKIPNDVLLVMKNAFQMPSLDEGWDEIVNVPNWFYKDKV